MRRQTAVLLFAITVLLVVAAGLRVVGAPAAALDLALDVDSAPPGGTDPGPPVVVSRVRPTATLATPERLEVATTDTRGAATVGVGAPDAVGTEIVRRARTLGARIPRTPRLESAAVWRELAQTWHGLTAELRRLESERFGVAEEAAELRIAAGRCERYYYRAKDNRADAPWNRPAPVGDTIFRRFGFDDVEQRSYVDLVYISLGESGRLDRVTADIHYHSQLRTRVCESYFSRFQTQSGGRR